MIQIPSHFIYERKRKPVKVMRFLRNKRLMTRSGPYTTLRRLLYYKLHARFPKKACSLKKMLEFNISWTKKSIAQC